jgi:outer membrane protein assembly factor BamB
MSEIQAQIAVEDVNNDGNLGTYHYLPFAVNISTNRLLCSIEMIAVDRNGNVLCFDRHGTELWARSISGFSAQAPSFGDIDGDGIMDVVIGTVPGMPARRVVLAV